MNQVVRLSKGVAIIEFGTEYRQAEQYLKDYRTSESESEKETILRDFGEKEFWGSYYVLSIEFLIKEEKCFLELPFFDTQKLFKAIEKGKAEFNNSKASLADIISEYE